MKLSFKKKRTPLNIISTFLIVTIVSSCQKEELPVEIPYYSYDFESDYTNIDSLYVSTFNGEKLLGPFNNSGFSVRLESLPNHDYIHLEFDLYIHDSWVGNTNELGISTPDHDAWFIEFDPHLKIKASEKIYFETTFSNGLCIPGWCYTQSYPNEFPFNNEARTNTRIESLPGRCFWQDSPVGSSMYRISKTFPNNKKSTVIAFYDRLKSNGYFDALCEKSWSLDNLSISLIQSSE